MISKKDNFFRKFQVLSEMINFAGKRRWREVCNFSPIFQWFAQNFEFEQTLHDARCRTCACVCVRVCKSECLSRCSVCRSVEVCVCVFERKSVCVCLCINLCKSERE